MKILSINISNRKGQKKRPVEAAELIKDHGIKGDAHAGTKKELSLLMIESIKGLDNTLQPGAFAENITTEGIDLKNISIGTRLRLGDGAAIEITERGKVCHDRCEIYYRNGRCIMPDEGLFAKVLVGGIIKESDQITILTS